jgi:hypothetical protein
LKASFTTTPFSIHAEPFKPFILKTTIFDFVIDVILSQLGEDNILHHVDFRSYNFFLFEINYDIHDKELLAIMDAFEKWCHLFKGVQCEIIVYSNHRNL